VQAPPLDDCAHAGVAVGDERVQVGTAPAQRVQAAQHVGADRDVDGAQLEQVEGVGLPVVAGGQEARDAQDLAGVSRLGQLQQPRVHGAELNPAAADVDPADGTWETSHPVPASISGQRGRIALLAQETMHSQPTATPSSHPWHNLSRRPSNKNQIT
jgi:hypothetical protein